ncbi:uncharacterized protein LOC106057749 isoform X2 [Biomphalaria glabrata]|uniref:Uncharacterized protein LOC106057749 isoform X2 n=1 Tax=Biomphalaria glabrata TaxID=6526 RepID=A0A9W3AHB1_BIOGL|nr:uncharacterized protein LOC106057749 isoform X2 [Biomphalaria glabrata]
MSPKPMSHSRWTASPRPLFNTTFDQYVYTLEILKTTAFDTFDLVRTLPSDEKAVRMNDINIRGMHMKSSGRKSNRSKLRSVQQSRRRRNTVQDYYPQSRRRRNTVQDYYVDVVAMIDYKRYSKFLSQASYNNFAAMQNILEYYAFVFSGMDMLYEGIKHPEYTIHILLSKIYVLQTVTSSSFIEKNASYDETNGDIVLKNLRVFNIGAGRSIVGNYDHVMLFTGYELFSEDSNNDKRNILGVAYGGTICRTDGKSSSVIEDRQGYSTCIYTAAHELAHGLSALHDGDDNPCNASERYIMGSLDAEKRPGTEYNPWLFSPCSVSYFTSLLKEKLNTSRGYTCLVYAIEASADIPDVSDKLLGQLIKPDQQCQQFYGNDSMYCRASEPKSSVTEICLAMSCADNLRDICIPQIALMGTSCGDGKICMNGKCVSDPYAPQLDENCAFGDKPDKTCEWYIHGFIGHCYSSVNYQLCCNTCNNVSRPVKGCEYGDRSMDCTQDHCLDSKVDCCGTCNYGTPFTPTYSTRRSTPKRLATTVNPLVIFTSTKGCEPGDQDLIPELCTNFSVCLIQPAQCCHYCSLYHTSTTASTTTTRPLIPPTSPKTKCEPGDLDLKPEQCLNPSVCKTQPLQCCNYCSLYFKNKSMTTPTIQFTTPTSPKECEPGDLDLRPELCTNTSVCQTNSSLCCHYCSLHYKSANTSTTQLTSPNECVLGEPDLSPQLCTSPSICQTQPLMCCKYCSSRDNSASRLSLYTLWIEIYIILYCCFLHCVLLLYVY